MRVNRPSGLNRHAAVRFIEFRQGNGEFEMAEISAVFSTLRFKYNVDHHLFETIDKTIRIPYIGQHGFQIDLV